MTLRNIVPKYVQSLGVRLTLLVLLPLIASKAWDSYFGPQSFVSHSPIGAFVTTSIVVILMGLVSLYMYTKSLYRNRQAITTTATKQAPHPQNNLGEDDDDSTDLAEDNLEQDESEEDEELEEDQEETSLEFDDELRRPPFSIESLPVEVWERIFSYCEDKTLANAVPRVCKFSRDLAHPNSEIWKVKCKSVGLTAPGLTTTWKRLYLANLFRMWPLLDFTIGKTSYDRLLNHTDAKSCRQGNAQYVTIQKYSFWVTDRTFSYMHLARNNIPPEWEAFGVTWERSWNGYKELFKRWNGNFEVVRAPHYREYQNKACFYGRLTTVAYDPPNVYYMVDLTFNYREGDEDTPGTLYSISISSPNYVPGVKRDYKAIYQERNIIDRPANLDLNNVVK